MVERKNMTVRELIEKLQELPEDSKIKYISGQGRVRNLDVYFEEQKVWIAGEQRTEVVMYGDY